MSIFWKVLLRMFTNRRPIGTPQTKQPRAAKSNFEVERKFRLAKSEYAAIEQRLKELGFSADAAVEMTDYFLPVKVDGEMHRVRDEAQAGQKITLVTIKEWVTVAGGRERSELEGGIGSLERYILLLVGRTLRGSRLLSFSKKRIPHTSPQAEGVVIALDTVFGLGKFSGPYVEIEVLVPQDGDVEAARAKISAIARALFTDDREFVQASYQDMLKQATH